MSDFQHDEECESPPDIRGRFTGCACWNRAMAGPDFTHSAIEITIGLDWPKDQRDMLTAWMGEIFDRLADNDGQNIWIASGPPADASSEVESHVG